MTNMITFEGDINASREHVYDAFLVPEGLRQWHRPTDDWTTPHEETDSAANGPSSIDPAGGHSPGFSGEYTELDRPNRIAYMLDDGRKVEVNFTDAGNGGTHVRWSFEPESGLPDDMQLKGWASQFQSLKLYVEPN